MHIGSHEAIYILLAQVMSQLLLLSHQGFPILAIILGFMAFKLFKITKYTTTEAGKYSYTSYIYTHLNKLSSILNFFVSGPNIILKGYEDVSSKFGPRNACTDTFLEQLQSLCCAYTG